MAYPTAGNPNPEDKEKQEKLKALSDALGLGHFQSEIDSIKDNNSYIRSKLEELIQGFNNLANQNNATVQAQATPMTQTPANMGQLDQVQKVQMLSDAADGIAKIVTAWKGTGQGAPQGFQMDLITTIIGAFSKLIQIQVDNAVLNTYPQAKGMIQPPDWVTKSSPPSHEPA